ncbi:MAG: hypothetical protein ABL993_14965, partial [Vicinamibacterales bacterium]
TNVAPTSVEIHALETSPPVIPDVQFVAKDGGSGYASVFPEAAGRPVTVADTIDSGPYQGMIGLLTNYTLNVTGKVVKGPDSGAEVALQRRMQTVAIPVFQFGVFSNPDLAFHAGSNFNFGGRVHTNGNLFLAASDGFTLTLAQRVTAVGEVIRTNIENSWPTAGGGYNGTVSMAQAPNAYFNITTAQGSLVGNLGTALNDPTWKNLSENTSNGYIRNGRTGARTLNLPFVSQGATPLDLIRRGVAGENAFILQQRYYSMVSLRILLSDTAAEITGLPGVTNTPPVPLNDRATLVALGFNAPDVIALSGGNLLAGGGGNNAGIVANTVNLGLGAHNIYRTQAGTPLHGGFIKIEMQRMDETWVDVTMEILNLGVSGKNPAVANCADPSPNAIIRIQRVRNLPSTANACGLLPVPANPANTYSTTSTDYWPQVLYDAREGLRREGAAINPVANNNLYLGGVMHYIELDARNLSRWFQGAIGVSGLGALGVNGYSVYFSDRRGNKDLANAETGRYGAEDFVNPASGTGVANGVLNGGEDIDGDGALDVYGQTPIANLAFAQVPLTNAARPWTDIQNTAGPPVWAWPDAAGVRPTAAEMAQANRAILFRRALKLTNGGLGNLVAPGLTIAAENPIYVQGNWNASAAGFGAAGSVATSVIADAVTVLSNSWNDVISFTSQNGATGLPDIANQRPSDRAERTASTTWYRMAVLAGKPITFNFNGGAEESFGADGGVHNFLRMLEDWNGDTINYLGSIAMFYINQQATGIFKCCDNVYRQPTVRNFTFDVNFLNPALLPPLTPMFRDLNTTGFTQVIE